MSAHCRSRHPDLWLLGEAVNGDYTTLAEDGIGSITNYEAFKGLWSSHNDRNYFEIAYSLNRQFGRDGIYRDLYLYSFADNHDVDRIATKLSEPAHLYTLYLLLVTMPGSPSIYYGSEWGIEGRRTQTSDAALRPELDLETMRLRASQPDLPAALRRLFAIRRERTALQSGAYAELHVAAEQFAFSRGRGREAVIVAANASAAAASFQMTVPEGDGHLRDLLNDGARFSIVGGRCSLPLDPHWGRVLVYE